MSSCARAAAEAEVTALPAPLAARRTFACAFEALPKTVDASARSSGLRKGLRVVLASPGLTCAGCGCGSGDCGSCCCCCCCCAVGEGARLLLMREVSHAGDVAPRRDIGICGRVLVLVLPVGASRS